MNVKKAIRVILVDDHTLIRRGIRRILEKDPLICVIAEASSGAEAIRLVNKMEPDVLLLDIEMPDMKGYQVAQELRACRVSVSILALSSGDETHFIEEIKQTGIDGYIKKGEAVAKIQQAIHAVNEKRSGFKMNLSLD
jgi:DNA-binding NarL/FixJ family response regulator